MTVIKILLISGCCLLVGTAGLAGFMGGPEDVLAAPLLAVFGWFFIVPIFVVMSLMWALYTQRLSTVPLRILFVTSGCLIGAGFMYLVALSGMRGPEPSWLYGYLLGGGLGGGVSCFLITVLKRHFTEPAAGGKAE